MAYSMRDWPCPTLFHPGTPWFTLPRDDFWWALEGFGGFRTDSDCFPAFPAVSGLLQPYSGLSRAIQFPVHPESPCSTLVRLVSWWLLMVWPRRAYKPVLRPTKGKQAKFMANIIKRKRGKNNYYWAIFVVNFKRKWRKMCFGYFSRDQAWY